MSLEKKKALGQLDQQSGMWRPLVRWVQEPPSRPPFFTVWLGWAGLQVGTKQQPGLLESEVMGEHARHCPAGRC